MPILPTPGTSIRVQVHTVLLLTHGDLGQVISPLWALVSPPSYMGQNLNNYRHHSVLVKGLGGFKHNFLFLG